jgi:hypothetical protein
LQVTRGAGENAFESYKAVAYKIDQESSDVGALPGLMVKGEGFGALAFQGGGAEDFVGLGGFDQCALKY